MSPQDIWQAQSLDAPRISIAYLRQRAEKVQSLQSSRTGLTVTLNLLLAVYFVYRGFTRFTGKPFTQGFFVVCFFSAVYGAIYWLRREPRKPLIPEDAGELDSLHFFRREVERRISNISRYALWGALVGPVMGSIVALLCLENGWLSHRLWIYLAVKSCVVFPAVILILCARRKRFLREELAALDSLGQR
ncbi:MAG TPA: hypothetical protein VGO61_06415 [Steroidobacteraceae bacterium]|jgi:Na+/proline symporter|nr:hypothetical protein [Steroidobacteraceae bacterium]